MDYSKYIAVTPDFPTKGISFKDISPLLLNPDAFETCINDLAKLAEKYQPDIIIGPESRGFIFGAALANKMHKGFVMARKAGKLPGKTYRIEYALEYGTATLELPALAVKEGQRVLLVDDLLATGGSLKALGHLVEEMGATPIAALTVINLIELKGWEKLKFPCECLVELSADHE